MAKNAASPCLRNSCRLISLSPIESTWRFQFSTFHRDTIIFCNIHISLDIVWISAILCPSFIGTQYVRTTRVNRPDGKVDEYIRLVESQWNNGRPRHRVICNLGRKELAVGPPCRRLVAPRERRGKNLPPEPPSGGGGSLGLGSDVGGAALLERTGTGMKHRLAGEPEGKRRTTG